MIRPTIFAIDPGSSRSAWLLLVPVGPVATLPAGHPGFEVRSHGLPANGDLLNQLRGGVSGTDQLVPYYTVDDLVIEWTAPRGMPASAELFETMFWAGQFAEAARHATHAPSRIRRLARGEVKRHLCGTTAAKDTNVHAALIDRFGGTGGKEAAVGRKASQGPLYGVVRDVWAALGVAVTWSDLIEQGREP